jgi:hypothetical protein
VGAEGLPPSGKGGAQISGKASATPVLKIRALFALSSPITSPTFTGMLTVNWSGAVGLPLVVAGGLEATAEYLPPPAGRRTRSFTLFPALPDAIRQATIVPFTGEEYDASAVDPDHWMNVQPWPPQDGWFSRVAVLVVARLAGPSTTVPAGCAAEKSSRAITTDGETRSQAAARTRIRTAEIPVTCSSPFRRGLSADVRS